MARTRASLPSLAVAALLAGSLGPLATPVAAQTTATRPPATTTTSPTAAKPGATKPAAKPATAGAAAKATVTAKQRRVPTSTPAKPTAAKPASAKPVTPKPAAAAPKPAVAGAEAPRPAAPASPSSALAPASPSPPSAQTTPLRDAGPVAAAATGTSAAGTSFLARHPVLGGFATGLLGTSLAERMLGGGVGAQAPAQGPGGTNLLEPVPQTSHAAETVGQFGRLALFGGLVYLGVAAWRRRAEETAPAAAMLRDRAVPRVSDWDEATEDVGPAFDAATHDHALKHIADEDDFAEILRAVQSAWSEGNIALIRAHVTPEMADHYNDALAQNSRNGIESRVEQVVDVHVERLRDWQDEGLQYAKTRLRWKALDYLIDAAKTPDEPGYVIDGSAEVPVDCEETWTFVKVPDGAWVLTDVEAAE